MRSVGAFSLAKSMFSTRHLLHDLARGLLRDDAEPPLHPRQRRLDLEVIGRPLSRRRTPARISGVVKMSRKIIEFEQRWRAFRWLH